MVDVLAPLVEQLGVLVASAPDDRDAPAGALINQALTAAAALLGPSEGTRACYFAMDTADGTTKLIAASHTGRADPPTTTFQTGTPSGDFVIAMLQSDEFFYCHDTKQDPPPGWEEHQHQYRTFISVPARIRVSGGQVEYVGMVSVDALRPGDLKDSDHGLLRALGSVIAVADRLANPREAGA